MAQGRQVKSGDWEDYGNFLCGPAVLDEALAAFGAWAFVKGKIFDYLRCL
jgi:hypothetical protein